ncbi:hypothetical protein WG936_08185 [Corynebacterium sp. H127]|uniref:hypothetical protein n=1 Tax=Corynebacterium sp. H127 TaxID=3133418 RepID=UPI0030AE776E
MPRIEITAAEWTQVTDEGRFIRRTGDVCTVSDAEAKRLVGCGAAKETRRKITVEDQKQTKPPATEDTETDPIGEEVADEEAAATVETEDNEVPKPAATATEAKWQEYAISQGMSADEAESMSRDELRAFFADK